MDDAPEAPSPIEVAADWVADTYGDTRAGLARALRELGELDRAVYATVADVPTPTLDEPLRRLSNAANFSRLWLGIAAALGVVGGRRGRRAGLTGAAAIGVASALVNQGLKRLYPRARPDRLGEEVPETRHVRMPTSTSFPSGHSASGFAFAGAVADTNPHLAIPLEFLAAAVAYSRVHTGVHYPGDAVIGSLIGAATGDIVATAARWWLDRRGGNQ